MIAIKKLKLLSIFVLSACSFAATAGTISLVATPAEPVVTVRLAENPFSGKEWLVAKSDNHLLEGSTSEYSPSDFKKLKAGGFVEYHFMVKESAFTKPQKTTVILEYKNPMDDTALEQQIVEINIVPK